MAGKSKVKSSSSPKFLGGGSGKMFGKQHAGSKASGVTGKSDSTPGGKFAKGGSGHMFGKQSASPRKSGTTGK